MASEFVYELGKVYTYEGKVNLNGLENSTRYDILNLAIRADFDDKGRTDWSNLRNASQMPVITQTTIKDKDGKVLKGTTSGFLDAAGEKNKDMYFKETHGGNNYLSELIGKIPGGIDKIDHLRYMADSGEIMRSIGPVQQAQITLAPDPANVKLLENAVGFAAKARKQGLVDDAFVADLNSALEKLQALTKEQQNYDGVKAARQALDKAQAGLKDGSVTAEAYKQAQEAYTKALADSGLKVKFQEVDELWKRIEENRAAASLVFSESSDAQALLGRLDSLRTSPVPSALFDRDSQKVKPNGQTAAAVRFMEEYNGKAAVAYLGEGARVQWDPLSGQTDLGKGLRYNVEKEGYSVDLKGTARYGYSLPYEYKNKVEQYKVDVTARFAEIGKYFLKDGIPHLRLAPSETPKEPSLLVNFSGLPKDILHTVQNGMFEGYAAINPTDPNLYFNVNGDVFIGVKEESSKQKFPLNNDGTSSLSLNYNLLLWQQLKYGQ